MRAVMRSCAIALSLVLGLGNTAAQAATSYYDQEGYQTTNQNVDGTSVAITPYSFHPVSGQCVLYSVLMTDFNPSLQVEAGLVFCNNATIDGTCNSGNGFAEAFDGTVYRCVQGSGFPLGSATTALVIRSTGTTSVGGAVTGAYISQTGFGATDPIAASAWGEATGGSVCPASPNSAAFTSWQQYVSSTGWSYVTSASASRYHWASGYPTTPCFAVGSLSSTGGFSVS